MELLNNVRCASVVKPIQYDTWIAVWLVLSDSVKYVLIKLHYLYFKLSFIPK